MLRRSSAITAIHSLVIITSLVTASWLRFLFGSSELEAGLLTRALTVLIPIKLVTFTIARFHNVWRGDALMMDLARICVVNVAATALSIAGIYLWIAPGFPRSVYLIDFLLCSILFVLIRVAIELRRGRLSSVRSPKHTVAIPQRPQPSWIPNLLLALTASLFVLCAILGAAVYQLATRSPQLNDLSTEDRQHLVRMASEIVPALYQPFPLAGPSLFYKMMPNTHYSAVLGDTFTTNDLGFRTIPTEKPEGVKRIVVVGDSWTFGQGVRYEETFAYELQKMLNRKDNVWQVYNLSMPGWNTANQLAALRAFFSLLQPDVVVFCPTSNDIDDSHSVWNGRLVANGFVSQARFMHSYFFHSRWIKAFQSLQEEVDRLKQLGVPALIYFLAEWRTLAPYYASASGFSAPYTVVPTKYIEKQYRLSPSVDAGGHATPEGNRMIASYLHNALLSQQLTTGVEPLPYVEPVVFPGKVFDGHHVAAEFKHAYRNIKRLDLIPLNDDLVGKEGLFSVEAPSGTRTVQVQLALIDDPGLYPLTVQVKLESPEQISTVKVFDNFSAEPQAVELTKPASLDAYPFVEVRVTPDRVIARGSTPASMKRPQVQIAR